MKTWKRVFGEEEEELPVFILQTCGRWGYRGAPQHPPSPHHPRGLHVRCINLHLS